MKYIIEAFMRFNDSPSFDFGYIASIDYGAITDIESGIYEKLDASGMPDINNIVKFTSNNTESKTYDRLDEVNKDTSKLNELFGGMHYKFVVKHIDKW